LADFATGDVKLRRQIWDSFRSESRSAPRAYGYADNG